MISATASRACSLNSRVSRISTVLIMFDPYVANEPNVGNPVTAVLVIFVTFIRVSKHSPRIRRGIGHLDCSPIIGTTTAQLCVHSFLFRIEFFRVVQLKRFGFLTNNLAHSPHIFAIWKNVNSPQLISETKRFFLILNHLWLNQLNKVKMMTSARITVVVLRSRAYTRDRF